MDFIKGGRFEEFEAILKKMLEHFQGQEHKEENVEVMFDKINSFHERKNEIEDYEKTINSRTRPLRLGFVGGFSTGKSSMINSLLGEEILGVKLEPATAQITELSYGDKFEVLEVTQDDDYFYYNEVSLEDYQKSSTIRVNKSSNLSHYVIKHPSKNLSRFTIVDTPGFSSTSKEDDDLTKNWIETLDLLIWIFDANKVGDKTEYDKLKELGSSTKVIGVINKIDTKSPGVREKIRNEILNEEFLDDVLFYSSKKVLDNFTKSKSFNEVLEDITSEIKDCVNNSESFEINNSNSGIIFKTPATTKPFGLIPIKTTTYTEYYDTLINKIDHIRNNEIGLILNQTVVKKHNDFRNHVKEELIDYQGVFTTDVSNYTNLIKENDDLLQKSEAIYENMKKDFDTKINASFKVFYTSFFDELGSFLFIKYVDSGVFSNDVYIHMKNLQDEEFKDSLHTFISQEFHSYLEESFNIYGNVIKNSVFNEYSKIEEIREDEYHLIRTLVDGLVNSSVEAIIGYHRNFEPDKKIESYIEALDFHKLNIDLVVPDELLENSISTLLRYDLIDARHEHYLPLMSDEYKELESQKNNTLEIKSMIDNLLLKLN